MAIDNELQSRSEPVNEDMPLQRRVWCFERLGWYVLLLLIILALLGLFSDGPLSHRQVSSPDGRLRLEYERFGRNGSSEQMVLHLKGHPNDHLQLTLGGTLLDALVVETLQPPPLRSGSQGEDLVWQLPTDAQGNAVLYLTLQINHAGAYRAVLSIDEQSVVHIEKLIYP
ncbi:MAG TPA: hypothetical protein VLC30_02110 [Pseudomonas sp.]|nr:hypothetical protein [Pseudomonas sp.]